MMLFAGQAAKHAVNRGPFRAGGSRPSPCRVALGAGLVMAPVVDALTASPAAAAPPMITAVGTTASMAERRITTLTGNPQHLGDVLVVVAEQNDNAEPSTRSRAAG